jgi:transcriptional regulator with XRE-family HTH domain
MLPTLKAGSAEMIREPPNPVDVYVGRRVRMRRIEINMSQEFLGEQIGLTFQQIQKYEKGANRIGASRIQAIGKVLEVPASFFFDGAPGGWEGESSQTSPALLELLGTRDRHRNQTQLRQPYREGGHADRQQAAKAEAIQPQAKAEEEVTGRMMRKCAHPN